MKKTVRVKNVIIGEGAPKIQSMLSVKTTDVSAALSQIERLAAAGCHIVRLGVPDKPSALALREIAEKSPLPVVADIHFDYNLALLSVESGAHKLRINPGNMGQNGLKKVTDAAKAAGIPIRVGSNSGSLEREAEQKYGRGARALAESALSCAAMLERGGFDDIVLSVKSSSVRETVEACRIIHQVSGYPQHIGITEAGGGELAEIKSAAGIGALLLDGIGDTLRVSLTGDPVREIEVARLLLRALRLDRAFAEVISCPTCARADFDVEGTAARVRELTAHITRPMVIAVMGCVVNGVGEGRHADIGIAGGAGKSVLFLRGRTVRTVDNEDLMPSFEKLLDEFLNEQEQGQEQEQE